MIPLLRRLYPWLRYYPCTTQNRLAEDCWQVGALSVTFRPVWLWGCEDARWCVDARDGEVGVNTPWVGLLWMPE